MSHANVQNLRTYAPLKEYNLIELQLLVVRALACPIQLLPLQKSGTCAAHIVYAICFCAALILRTCEPHSACVQNVRHKQNIGHMRKMCAGGIHCHMCAVCAQSSRCVQNMRSLRTILKICAQYVQFAHNMCSLRT